MTRIYAIPCIMTLLLCTSCGQAENMQADQPVLSDLEEVFADSQAEPSASYIRFAVQDAVTDGQLDEIAQILESRAVSSNPSLQYQMRCEYETASLRLEFDGAEEWAEQFVETAVQPNILELHKGGSLDDELLLTNANIESTEAAYADYYGGWCVKIQFDEAGTEIFADATAEVLFTDIPLSLWLDRELLFSARVSSQIIDGITLLSSFSDEQGAIDLAEKIRSAPLPYTVTADLYACGASES